MLHIYIYIYSYIYICGRICGYVQYYCGIKVAGTPVAYIACVIVSGNRFILPDTLKIEIMH